MLATLDVTKKGVYGFLLSNGVAVKKKTHETKAKLSLSYRGEAECIAKDMLAMFDVTDYFN